MLRLLEPVFAYSYRGAHTNAYSNTINLHPGYSNVIPPSAKRSYDEVCTYGSLMAHDTKSPYDEQAGLPVHAEAYPNAKAYAYDEGRTNAEAYYNADAYSSEERNACIAQSRWDNQCYAEDAFVRPSANAYDQCSLPEQN